MTYQLNFLILHDRLQLRDLKVVKWIAFTSIIHLYNASVSFSTENSIKMLQLVSALVIIAAVANAASIEEVRGTVNPCIGQCRTDCADGLPILCGFIPSATGRACETNFFQANCRLTCQQCKLSSNYIFQSLFNSRTKCRKNLIS